MEEFIEVNLCMGSSCFARGNDRLLEALEGAIKENAWEDRVRLAGSRCENRCGNGPNVFIDGALHQGVDANFVIGLLNRRLEQAGKEQAQI